MTAIFDIGVPVLAVIILLVAFVFLVRALSRRTKTAGPLVYGVGRQEARQAMQADLIRSMALIIISLILLGVFGLRPLPAELDPQVEVTSPPVITAEPTVTATAVATIIITQTATPFVIATAEATPTSPLLAPTDTPEIEPTETATPEPLTAVVDSPNGLWLRDAPGADTTQLENLAHNTILILLPGRETVDELEWQEVRAPSGLEGWVAVQFIIYQ